MNMEIGKRVLITTNEWFLTPDGKSCKGVYGTVKNILSSEETLGVKTNSKSTNWYVEIGDMLVAGCQIHYAIITDKCNEGEFENWSASAENGINIYNSPSQIYFADRVANEQ